MDKTSFMINNRFNPKFGLSPFNLIYCRNSRGVLPFVDKEIVSNSNINEWMARNSYLFEDWFKEVENYYEKASNSSINNFLSKKIIEDIPLTVNSVVFLKSVSNSFSDPRWVGPYRITYHFAWGGYTLHDIRANKTLNRKVPRDLLKLVYPVEVSLPSDKAPNFFVALDDPAEMVLGAWRISKTITKYYWVSKAYCDARHPFLWNDIISFWLNKDNHCRKLSIYFVKWDKLNKIRRNHQF